MKVRTKVRTKVHVFVTLYTFDLVSFGFTLQFCKRTKDLYVTKLRPAVITYVSCVSRYLELIGLLTASPSSRILSLGQSLGYSTDRCSLLLPRLFLFCCDVEKQDTGTFFLEHLFRDKLKPTLYIYYHLTNKLLMYSQL